MVGTPGAQGPTPLSWQPFLKLCAAGEVSWTLWSRQGAGRAEETLSFLGFPEVQILTTWPGPQALPLLGSLHLGQWSCVVSWLKSESGPCWAPTVAMEFLLEGGACVAAS